MEYRSLQNADFEISEIGLGCASFWGKKSFSEKQAFEVFAKAVDSGINYFDTGHSYSGGHAETRLGKALQLQHGGNDFIVSSKAGTRMARWGRLYNDFSPAWIRQSCETSLYLLQREHLPIFFLHGPNPEDFTDELLLTLEQMQQAGMIGLVGVNAFADHILELCLQLPQIQCVMLDFNVYKPHRKTMIKRLKAAGKDVFVAGALAGAIYDQRFWRFQGRKSLWYWLRAWKNNPHLKAMKNAMQCLNQIPGVSATQAALAYVLNNADFSTALVGSTQSNHLEELMAAAKIELGGDLIKQIESQAEKIGCL